jgi:hypothetical protein
MPERKVPRRALCRSCRKPGAQNAGGRITRKQQCWCGSHSGEARGHISARYHGALRGRTKRRTWARATWLRRNRHRVRISRARAFSPACRGRRANRASATTTRGHHAVLLGCHRLPLGRRDGVGGDVEGRASAHRRDGHQVHRDPGLREASSTVAFTQSCAPLCCVAPVWRSHHDDQQRDDERVVRVRGGRRRRRDGGAPDRQIRHGLLRRRR